MIWLHWLALRGPVPNLLLLAVRPLIQILKQGFETRYERGLGRRISVDAGEHASHLIATSAVR